VLKQNLMQLISESTIWYLAVFTFHTEIMTPIKYWFIINQYFILNCDQYLWSYLSSLINLTTSRALRSSSLSLLHVPFTTTAIGRKAFRFAAPTIWNSIPLRIRSLPSLNSFKRSLKTNLFSLNSLWSWPCYTGASDSSLLEFMRYTNFV